jgi:hypothetical protein
MPSLLKEFNLLEYSTETVKDSKEKNDGKIILKGIFQRADTLNQNGRIYPRAILEREVRNYQRLIKEGRAVGEANHPDTSVVDIKNASHKITKLWMEDNTCYGELEILNKLPSGKIIEGLFEHDVKLGISSRGVGSTTHQGDHDIVNEDFILVCFDLVLDPSTSGAFLHENTSITHRDLEKSLSKQDRINRLLNDILKK